jgi:GST-like protein
MLEELGVAYRTVVVDILRGDQFEAPFVSINPNSKIPALVDDDGPGGLTHSLFESGSILIYLAEKFHTPLLPEDSRARHDTLTWLMFQLANIGPMFGQYHHFHSHAKERIDYALNRYGVETRRLYDVLDARLKRAPFLSGVDYTIADIATYPWIARFEDPAIGMGIGERPSLRRWYDRIGERAAVRRGMAAP